MAAIKQIGRERRISLAVVPRSGAVAGTGPGGGTRRKVDRDVSEIERRSNTRSGRRGGAFFVIIFLVARYRIHASQFWDLDRPLPR